MQEAAVNPSPTHLGHRFTAAFGEGVEFESPLGPGGLGARVSGIDLSVPLRAAQVELLLDALSYCRLDWNSGGTSLADHHLLLSAAIATIPSDHAWMP